MVPPSTPPFGSQSKPPGPERRAEARAPIELKVEYRRLNSFFADYTRNISRGGTFIATEKPLPVGTEFLFRIAVPGNEGSRVFELKGRVAWIAPNGETSPTRSAGMGIQFLFADDAEREQIQHSVEDLMVENFGPDLARRLMDERDE